MCVSDGEVGHLTDPIPQSASQGPREWVPPPTEEDEQRRGRRRRERDPVRDTGTTRTPDVSEDEDSGTEPERTGQSGPRREEEESKP